VLGVDDAVVNQFVHPINQRAQLFDGIPWVTGRAATFAMPDSSLAESGLGRWLRCRQRPSGDPPRRGEMAAARSMYALALTYYVIRVMFYRNLWAAGRLPAVRPSLESDQQ